MRLARRATRLCWPIAVRLLTPEEHPLVVLRRSVVDFFLAACAQVDVEVRFGVHLDPDGLAGSQLVGGGSVLEDAALTIVIPSRRASPLLRDWGDSSVLIPVDDRFATAAPGIFVAGDAAASSDPRAADAAAVSGVIAAEAILTALAYHDGNPGRTPGAGLLCGPRGSPVQAHQDLVPRRVSAGRTARGWCRCSGTGARRSVRGHSPAPAGITKGCPGAVTGHGGQYRCCWLDEHSIVFRVASGSALAQ